MKLERGRREIAPHAIGDQFFLQKAHGTMQAGTFVTISSLCLTVDGWAVTVTGLVRRGQEEPEVLLPKNYAEYLGNDLPPGYRRTA